MGVTDRKEREKEARRDCILDASRDLFREKGFRATTIDEIAERSELGRGTIYLYFPGKESIYFGLLTSSLEKLRDDLAGLLGKFNSPMEAIEAASEASRRFHRQRRGLSELMLIEVDENWEDIPNDLVESHKQAILEIFGLLRGLIERVAAEYDRELPFPLEASVLFFALEVGIFAVNRMAPPELRETLDITAVFDLARDVMVKGLLGLSVPVDAEE